VGERQLPLKVRTWHKSNLKLSIWFLPYLGLSFILLRIVSLHSNLWIISYKFLKLKKKLTTAVWRIKVGRWESILGGLVFTPTLVDCSTNPLGFEKHHIFGACIRNRCFLICDCVELFAWVGAWSLELKANVVDLKVSWVLSSNL